MSELGRIARSSAALPRTNFNTGSKMDIKDRIIGKLTAALQPEFLEVIDESHKHAGHSGWRPGGETHFRVRLVAAALQGKSRIERHRTINGLLADELKAGVHALAIEARAPGESGPGAPLAEGS